MAALAVSIEDKLPEPGEPVRVAVVDDSVVVRGLLARWLSETAGIKVCGVHRNGAEALGAVGETRPDVLLLDIEMPEMDGVTALPLLLLRSPATRILIVSSHSIRGADITLRCLLRGATDYLTKPDSLGALSTSADFRRDLIHRVLALGADARQARTAGAVPLSGDPRPAREADAPRRYMSGSGPARFAFRPSAVAPGFRLRPASLSTPDVVLIAASTGGPAAIARTLEGLGPLDGLPPIVVAQHMSQVFTGLLARHLSRQLGIEAVEVSGGERLRPGVVHVCQGGRNRTIEQDGYHFRVGQGRNRQDAVLSPSADVLFSSAADACGPGVLALVLTGMGEDGALGAAAIAEAGGTVIAQDAASSVVWGMPGAVARAGHCSAIGTPAELARFVRSLTVGYQS